jgi:hypothetical protein
MFNKVQGTKCVWQIPFNKAEVSVQGIELWHLQSVEHNSYWQANSFPASRGILRILWNPKIPLRVHNILTPVRELGHINPVHAIQYYLSSDLILSPN